MTDTNDCNVDRRGGTEGKEEEGSGTRGIKRNKGDMGRLLYIFLITFPTSSRVCCCGSKKVNDTEQRDGRAWGEEGRKRGREG